jgi:HSP20 family protein
MALVRFGWEPFREIDTLQRQMNHLFDSLTTSTEDVGAAFVPPAELHETPDALQLKLELPGMNREDIDVQVTADAIAISGERKSERHAEEKGVTRSEFRYGKFRRVIPLPIRVQNTGAHGEYKDGILSLTLPKAEEEKNRVVKVDLG